MCHKDCKWCCNPSRQAISNKVESTIQENIAKGVSFTCQQRTHDSCRYRNSWNSTYCSHHKSIQHCLAICSFENMRATKDDIEVNQQPLINAIGPPEHTGFSAGEQQLHE